jgi:glycosyltransferase involved in cell wall biosynthesis
MKIALANNLYYPYNRGGAETVIKQMIADLKSQGHDIFLITTKPKKGLALPEETTTSKPANNELKIYYFPSYYYNLATLPSFIKVIWHLTNIFSWHKTDAIKKILIKEKPELIITHNLMGLGFLLPQAIKKLQIHHEHYLHDIQLLYPTGLMILGKEKIIDGLSAKIYQFFTRAFLLSPAKVISPSLWLLEQHRQRGFFKNSQTEIKNLTALKNATVVNHNQPVKNFLFVGQIEEHKGIMFLLAAFQSALETKPEIRLTIIGDGILLVNAKKIAENNKQIEFRGRLSSDKVKEIMAENDFLIVPSLCYENAPMTIYEAHASGLKVLAANIGGIPEIINNYDKLFKPGDIVDLKNKILDIS